MEADTNDILSPCVLPDLFGAAWGSLQVGATLAAVFCSLWLMESTWSYIPVSHCATKIFLVCRNGFVCCRRRRPRWCRTLLTVRLLRLACSSFWFSSFCLTVLCTTTVPRPTNPYSWSCVDWALEPSLKLSVLERICRITANKLLRQKFQNLQFPEQQIKLLSYACSRTYAYPG